MLYSCRVLSYLRIFFFLIGKCKKIMCILVIPPIRPLTQPFSNGEKKTSTEVVFMESTLLKETDTAAGFGCLCSFVKLYSCKEFSFFCKS